MMFHKLDKLQSDVDELLDLCAESGGEELPHQDLGEMILRAQDGELGKRGMNKLSKMLKRDEEALRYYIDFQMLTALLYEHFGHNRVNRFLETLKLHTAAGS